MNKPMILIVILIVLYVMMWCWGLIFLLPPNTDEVLVAETNRYEKTDLEKGASVLASNANKSKHNRDEFIRSCLAQMENQPEERDKKVCGCMYDSLVKVENSKEIIDVYVKSAKHKDFKITQEQYKKSEIFIPIVLVCNMQYE